MDAGEAATAWQDGGRDRTTVRLGALALPAGILLALVATVIHPHREEVMDNQAVFMEYAESGTWVAVHFAQWLGVLLLLTGLLGVYYTIRGSGGQGAGLARFGAAAGVQAGAAFTALQAVDGVALKWGVDSWAGAGGGRRDAVFAAAEAVRWTEYGLQAYSNVLLGLTLVLFGLAIAIDPVYPQWLGWLATGSGVAWVVHGAMVPYIGLFDSIPRSVGMALLALWGAIMSVLMWRVSGRYPVDQTARGTAAPPINAG